MVIRPRLFQFVVTVVRDKAVMLLLVAVPVGIWGGLGPIAGITAGSVSALIVAVVVRRTRLEVSPDAVLVSNGLRSHRIPARDIANIFIQEVEYDVLSTRYRLCFVTGGGSGASVHATATERRSPSLVTEIYHDVVEGLEGRVHGESDGAP